VRKEVERDALWSIQISSISLGPSDHACILFDESGENAKDVMAIVELKMSDSSCGPIHTEIIKGKPNAKKLDMGKDHGPIGQNIIYILDQVISDLVRNNIQ